MKERVGGSVGAWWGRIGEWLGGNGDSMAAVAKSEASLIHVSTDQSKKDLKTRTHGKVEEICEGNWSRQRQWWPSNQINCGCSQHLRTGTYYEAVLFHLPMESSIHLQ